VHLIKPITLASLGLISEYTSVAAALKINGLNIFATPSKFINRFQKLILIHSIGGRCQKNEPYPDALKREIAEEIGINVLLLSSSKTKIIFGEHSKNITSISDNPKNITSISDNPKPYCVYIRTNKKDVNFYSSDVRSMIGYKVESMMASITPSEELGLIVFLTDKMLIKCISGKVSLRDILNSNDESKAIITHRKIDLRKSVIPAGLAMILANDLLRMDQTE
jgi:hypothetical protein